MTVPVALSIAGSDPSGGAGIQADLGTFAAFGVRGATVVTALTAQNTEAVREIAAVEAGFVLRQLDAVLDELDVRAAKTGMLHRAEIVAALAERLLTRPVPHLVVDPVMVATSGAVLLDAAGVATLRDRLLPLATLVTPNLREAETLTGQPVADVAGMRAAARALVELGARAALVTGGHLEGDPVDVLFDGRTLTELGGRRVPVGRTHGTGCALSAAITAGLAHGRALGEAIEGAKRWLVHTLETGQKCGPASG